MIDKLFAGAAVSLMTAFTLVAGAAAVHMLTHAAHTWANAASSWLN